MIGAKVGRFVDGLLAPAARKIPFSPNAITLTGFAANAAAAWVLSFDLFWGGVLVLASGLFDMLDGIVARTNGKATRFGAWLDSLLDRFSDAFLFAAVSWHFLGRSLVGVLLAQGTLIGAFGVSYARARAEGLGVQCKVGLMERPERIVLLSVGAITGMIMPALWILFALTWLTVFQRALHTWKELMGPSR